MYWLKVWQRCSFRLGRRLRKRHTGCSDKRQYNRYGNLQRCNLLQGLPPSLNAIGMLIVQNLINFLIPSASGQAAVTMPIMIPLADLIGVNRQVAVLAFQFGDGFSIYSVLQVSY